MTDRKFAGRLTSQLQPNANQIVFTAEYGGPMSGDSSTPFPMPAFLLPGAMIEGVFDADRVEIVVSGSAGTLLGSQGGGIRFKSIIKAKRAR